MASKSVVAVVVVSVLSIGEVEEVTWGTFSVVATFTSTSTPIQTMTQPICKHAFPWI